MNVIAAALAEREVGNPVLFRSLSMTPLIGQSREPGDLLMEEALSQGCARVSEVSESGIVNQLKFVNRCDRSVLLLDGEEIIGAKQNRTLNITILALAGGALECDERIVHLCAFRVVAGKADCDGPGGQFTRFARSSVRRRQH